MKTYYRGNNSSKLTCGLLSLLVTERDSIHNRKGYAAAAAAAAAVSTLVSILLLQQHLQSQLFEPVASRGFASMVGKIQRTNKRVEVLSEHFALTQPNLMSPRPEEEVAVQLTNLFLLTNVCLFLF